MKKRVQSLIKKPKTALMKVTKRGSDLTHDDTGDQLAVPRITNETVAQHREEILRGARKFIYPLQHSKHRIVMISAILAAVATVTFFTATYLALYRFQNRSEFIYRVTKVLPFPAAWVKGDLVTYESYLFELRHFIHYYDTQQKIDFSTDFGKAQLAAAKKQALQKAIDNVYIRRIASEQGVSVTDKEVDDRIATLRDNARLGNSTKVYLDVLKDFYNWDEADFKRSIRDQLLAQKLLPKLDRETRKRAEAALAELQAGKDFGEVAKTHSDDSGTKDNKGDIGTIDRSSRDVSVQSVDALFSLQPGSYSGLIDVGYGLEILKNLEANGDKIHGARIVFNYKEISSFLNDRKENEPAKIFLSL